jgi:site-specific DNA-cytosine methylase
MIGIGIYGNNKENQYQKEITRALALKASNQTNPRSGGTTLVGEKIVEPNYTYEKVNETIRRNEFNEGEVKAMDLYNKTLRDVSPALTQPEHNGIGLFDGYRIRRLTPIECERLQGFPDNHTSFGDYDGEVKPVSNTQRYKQCGNAVTVDVVEAVANRLKDLF